MSHSKLEPDHQILSRWNQVSTQIQAAASLYGQPVSIVAVTKYGPAEFAKHLILSGAKIIGENRISDAESKLEILNALALPPFEAHLIGSLQRNKVKRALKLFSCIQSLDRDSLLHEIQNECEKSEQIICGMLQVNTAEEPNKSGYSLNDLHSRHTELFSFPNIKIIGIMAVTPFFSDPEKARPLFKKAHHLFNSLTSYYPSLSHLSMGMSNDFAVAIQEGSTMVRIGSALCAN